MTAFTEKQKREYERMSFEEQIKERKKDRAAERERKELYFKEGDRVKVAPDNDNEGYNSFRNQTLIVTHVARNRQEHPGYDEGTGGQLHDLKTLKGKHIGSSLYEWELVKA